MNKTLVTGGAVRNGNKFTLQEGIEYIHLLFSKNDGSDITADEIANADLMIEKGDTATDYIEHEQTDYILDIQQEMLEGDYFVREADGWKEVHGFGKYAFDGTENYIKSDSYSDENWFCGYSLNSVAPDAKIDGNMFTTRYAKIGSYGTITDDNCIACRPQFQTRISTEFLTENTAETYKNLLAQWKNEGKPLVAYYELATPTKLACTEAQSAVLEELSNLELFDDVNNIITAEDIALLKLKYALDVKTYVNNLIASQTTESEG